MAAPGKRRRERARSPSFSPDEWAVLAPLALVGFFSNYDVGLLALAAPPIAEGLGVEVATFGIVVAVIRLASLGNLATLRLADRWGRRQVLLLSVVGFTIATGLTALSWTLIAFMAFQMASTVFLSTEQTLSGVVISEELRPDRRGAGIGLLGVLGMSGFGLVVLVLLVVPHTPLGWRLFYVVALVPLTVVMYLRRNMRETKAFTHSVTHGRLQTSWWPRVAAHQRPRLWRVTALLAAVGFLETAAFFYAAELAQDTFGWTGIFSLIVVLAAPMTLVGYVVGGRLSDRIGRRPSLVIALVSFVVGTVLVFTEQRWLYAAGFFALTLANAATESLRSSYLSELFATEVRATLSAFVRSVSLVSGSLGLVVVGLLAPVVRPSVSLIVAAFAVLATGSLLRGLPETAGADVIESGESGESGETRQPDEPGEPGEAGERSEPEGPVAR